MMNSAESGETLGVTRIVSASRKQRLCFILLPRSRHQLLGNRVAELRLLMTEKPLEQMGLRDLREIMRQQVPAEAWKHFNGAAETKATFHRNPRAFRQYLFRQKIFHDVSEPDISIELFGHTLPIPAITAPVGSFSLIGKDAEREVAEGTERAGAMMFTSQAAKFDPKGWRARGEVAAGVHGLYEPRQGRSLGVRQDGAGSWALPRSASPWIRCKPVKIGDEVPLSTKDGKPRKGHKSTPKDIEWMKQHGETAGGGQRHHGRG